MKIRESIFKQLRKWNHLPREYMLPKWLRIIRFILFPLQTYLFHFNKSLRWDYKKDTIWICGNEFPISFFIEIPKHVNTMRYEARSGKKYVVTFDKD